MTGTPLNSRGQAPKQELLEWLASRLTDHDTGRAALSTAQQMIETAVSVGIKLDYPVPVVSDADGGGITGVAWDRSRDDRTAMIRIGTLPDDGLEFWPRTETAP